MKSFQTVTHDLARIVRAVEQISLQAETLSYGAGLATVTAEPAAARRTLEEISANLDRIIAKAREVELLVAAVPDPALAGNLRAPSVQLREAVTSLVVTACRTASDRALRRGI